jgi:hypothetical protein
MKTLVIYCTHKISFELNFFLTHGYYSDSNVDFHICFNNLDIDIERYIHDAKENGYNNLFFHKRINDGYDFAGWCYVLEQEMNGQKLYQLYDYFIFINTTCCGPFLPVYEKRKWVNIFTEMIDDQIKLVGPTVNFWRGRPHIQSYMFCTDKIGLDIAIKTDIFKSRQLNKNAVINNCEIRLSLEIMKAGYKIKSLLKGHETINYEKHIGQPEVILPFGSAKTDQMYENKYFGITPQIYEVIFFKSNRSITQNVLNKYIEMHNFNKKKS